MFNRTPPADPFAVFAQTYPESNPLRIPRTKAEPDEPQPVELGPTQAHQLLRFALGDLGEKSAKPTRNSASRITPTGWPGMSSEAREYSEEKGQDERDKRSLR